MYFKQNSRIYFFIQFIKEYLTLYRELSNYTKNILEQSAYHMYTFLDVLTQKSFNLQENQKFLFYQQIKLNSELVFLTKNATKHFNNIQKYMQNRYSTSNHSIFNIDELDKLLDNLKN